jgi:hypothetical protein
VVIRFKKINFLKPVLLLVAGFIGLTTSGQDVLSIQYSNDYAVAVNVSLECVEEAFKVRLKGSETNMLGKFSTANGIITFTPPFPFSSNQLYEVLCKENLIGAFTPAAGSTPSTRIVEIYPTQDTLPENLLKMHIRFSRPMGIGGSYQHISITENGKPIQPFLELEAELWNYDKTVFTLWLNPGRIKRDLAPNILEGNPLTKDNTYKLTINQTWEDQHGKALAEEFSKTFVAGSRDEDLPDVSSWKIESTSKTILVRFIQPLDYLLIQHSLSLWQAEKYLTMRTEIIDNRTVKLLPDHELAPGKYILKIDPKLEDLAGNNLTRPFDRDLTKIIESQPSELVINIEN